MSINIKDVKKKAIKLSDKMVDAFDTPEGQRALSELAGAMPVILVSLRFMRKARKAQKRGNHLEAIYYAIMWVGLTNNSANTKIVEALTKKPFTSSVTYTGNTKVDEALRQRIRNASRFN